MRAHALRDEYWSRPFDETTVQDVLGEPGEWTRCISNDANEMPDMRGAIILDVFVVRQELLIYIQGIAGSETVAVFLIEDQGLRQRTADALQIGAEVIAALQASL